MPWGPHPRLDSSLRWSICVVSQANAAAGGLLLNAVPVGQWRSATTTDHRYQRHLPSLPPLPQTAVIASHLLVVAYRRQRRQVQHATHCTTAAADRAIPALPATVPGPRRQTHQCGQCPLHIYPTPADRPPARPPSTTPGTLWYSVAVSDRRALSLVAVLLSIRASLRPLVCRSVDARPSTQALLQAIALLHPLVHQLLATLQQFL